MRNILFPSFPKELEAEFSRRYNEDAAPVARIALMFGIAVYLAFYFWDRVIDIDNSPKTLMIRIVVVLSAIAGLSLPRRIFSRHLQLIMITCITGAGLAHAAIMSILKDGLIHGIPGVVLILMYNFVFFRLLFFPSLVAGIIITVAHEEAVRHTLTTDFIIVENFFIVATLISGSAVSYLLDSLFRTQFLTNKQLDSERMRTNGLIESLFPARIAERLKAGETCIAESHGEVSVLFSDLVGFTSLTKKLSPGQLIDVLSDYFSMLDRLTEKHEIEKIKTIGDAYMVVSGLADEGRNTAEHIADFALEMVRSIHEYAEKHDFPLALRAGISTGQVISGVIGLKKPSFDLWGETVNLASRMESHSEPGHIQVSEATYWRLHEKYDFTRRGAIEVKGVGKVETFFLLRKKAEGIIAAPASSPYAWPDDTRPAAVAAVGEGSDAGTALEPDP
jgi:class 3 adenylate cyclase